MLNSLIKYLKQVKDFRGCRGKRHPLWLVLLIVILSQVSGHQGYREMEDWVKINYLRLRKTFNLSSETPPSYSTIRRVIKGVEWKELNQILPHWVQENYPQLPEIEGLSIDGKSLRSTVTRPGDDEQNMGMMISLFSPETGLVLTTEKWESKKGSELAVAQEVIGKCGLKRKLITADALHCNPVTVQQIIESGNEYLIPVKRNQIKLYNQIKTYTEQEKPESIHTTKETSHGRSITRKVSVFKSKIEKGPQWEHIQSLIQVERWGYRGKKTYQETVYYISSLLKEAEFFSQKIREHWQIENQVHWVKDVLLKEDRMKIRDIEVASNLALLNTLGLNIFRGLGFLSITQGRRWLGNHWEKLLALP